MGKSQKFASTQQQAAESFMAEIQAMGQQDPRIRAVDLMWIGLGTVQIVLLDRAFLMAERISFLGPISFQQPGLIAAIVLLSVVFFILIRNSFFLITYVQFFHSLNEARARLTLIGRSLVFQVSLLLGIALLARFM